MSSIILHQTNPEISFRFARLCFLGICPAIPGRSAELSSFQLLTATNTGEPMASRHLNRKPDGRLGTWNVSVLWIQPRGEVLRRSNFSREAPSKLAKCALLEAIQTFSEAHSTSTSRPTSWTAKMRKERR